MNKIIYCPICGFQSKIKYAKTIDYQYQTKFQPDYYICLNKECTHVFYQNKNLANTTDLYEMYTTHFLDKISPLSKLINIYINTIETIFSFARINEDKRKLLPVELNNNISLLDYGCGSGEFLYNLEKHGWTNISGFDFDTKALHTAKKRGVKCPLITIINNDIKYDAIVLNHVIEHISNLDELFNTLSEIKTVNGYIVIRTPNFNCLSSKIFKSFWRGLESPRHFHLFNARSIEKLVNKHNLSVIYLSTNNRLLFSSYLESCLNLMKTIHIPKSLTKISSLIFYPLYVFIHILLNTINPQINEELVVVIT